MNRTNLISLALAAVLACSPLSAQAQFDTGSRGGSGGSGQGQTSRPWEQFNLSKTKTMTLNFRNANVDLVLDAFMKASGITIIKDPSLTAPMTLSSAKAVKLGDAFEILNAALSVRNYSMEKQGNLLVIRQSRQRGNDTGAMFDPSQFQRPQSNAELKVYTITFAAANEVARVINEVFAMQSSGNAGFGGFGGFNNFGRGRQTQRGGGFDPRMIQQMMGQGGEVGVRASSDDFSNSVIVYAERAKQHEVEALIEQIDKQTEAPIQTKVYPLTYADASQLVTVVQNVLTSQAPTGRGNTRSNSGQQGGFGGFARLFGPSNNQATVSADTRSNALVVSATAEAQVAIGALVSELDKEVKVEQNTFVVPLGNAKADGVASLLQQAFGNRNTGNRTGNTGTGTNRTGTNNRNTQNRNNQNQNRNNTTGGRDVPDGFTTDGNQLMLQIDDMGADGEELATNVYAQQGGFFGFGQNRNNQNQGQGGGLGRGQDGRLVNVQDLAGQVTIIPDPATNSLIVVTDPANMQILQGIIGQLDRIPEQVMIETIIVEATLDKSLKLGVEWNYNQNPAFGNTGTQGNLSSGFGLANANPALQGLRYTLTGGNLTSFMNALATDDKFAVLSTPRIFTSNNVEAEINISQSVPYVLSTREDANGNLTFNYAFQDVGIVLNVIPRITSNGTVTLDVTQTANDLQGFTDFNAPIVNQRQAFTTVSVKDGETVVLGGMMRNTVTTKVKKLPLLGDIPILGELFKTRDNTSSKTELLVLLTPRLVKSEDDARKVREDETNKLSPQSQKALGGVVKDKSDGGPGFKKGPKNDPGNGSGTGTHK